VVVVVLTVGAIKFENFCQKLRGPGGSARGQSEGRGAVAKPTDGKKVVKRRPRSNMVSGGVGLKKWPFASVHEKQPEKAKTQSQSQQPLQ
jgi:hypothetical protein